MAGQAGFGRFELRLPDEAAGYLACLSQRRLARFEELCCRIEADPHGSADHHATVVAKSRELFSAETDGFRIYYVIVENTIFVLAISDDGPDGPPSDRSMPTYIAATSDSALSGILPSIARCGTLADVDGLGVDASRTSRKKSVLPCAVPMPLRPTVGLENFPFSRRQTMYMLCSTFSWDVLLAISSMVHQPVHSNEHYFVLADHQLMQSTQISIQV
jgi:hypothetical protein